MIALIIYIVISTVLVVLLIYEYIHDAIGFFIGKENGVLAFILFVSFFWPIALVHFVITKIDKILRRLRNENIELKVRQDPYYFESKKRIGVYKLGNEEEADEERLKKVSDENFKRRHGNKKSIQD
jgi:hypothetical protein